MYQEGLPELTHAYIHPVHPLPLFVAYSLTTPWLLPPLTPFPSLTTHIDRRFGSSSTLLDRKRSSAHDRSRSHDPRISLHSSTLDIHHQHPHPTLVAASSSSTTSTTTTTTAGKTGLAWSSSLGWFPPDSAMSMDSIESSTTTTTVAAAAVKSSVAAGASAHGSGSIATARHQHQHQHQQHPHQHPQEPPLTVKTYDAGCDGDGNGNGNVMLVRQWKQGKYDITAGTVEALVECLAEETAPPDTMYIEVFLLTYRHFTTPRRLMELLRARFHSRDAQGVSGGTQPSGDGAGDSPTAPTDATATATTTTATMTTKDHAGRDTTKATGSTSTTATTATASLIRIRVVSVLKKWVERHYYDFRRGVYDAKEAEADAKEADATDMHSQLTAFLADIEARAECQAYAAQIRRIVHAMEAKAEAEEAEEAPPPPPPPPPKSIPSLEEEVVVDHQQQTYLPQSSLQQYPQQQPPPLHAVDFLDDGRWPAKRFAQELTVVDMQLFKRIQPEEFCWFLWGGASGGGSASASASSSGDKNHNKNHNHTNKNDNVVEDPRRRLGARNFHAYIDRFNRIGFWVASVVCSQADVRQRAACVDKFLRILGYLRKYQNYNSLMAILAGLNNTAVSRLHKTWDLVKGGSSGGLTGGNSGISGGGSVSSRGSLSRSSRGRGGSRWYSAYQEIEAQMSYRGNFKAYRELEHAAKPPLVPFFGLHVKDLVFMNDGNPKYLSSVSPVSLVSGVPGVSLSPGSPAHESQTPAPPPSTPPPPPPPLVNFEKCRSIADKIHALRIHQQSNYQFAPSAADSTESKRESKRDSKRDRERDALAAASIPATLNTTTATSTTTTTRTTATTTTTTTRTTPTPTPTTPTTAAQQLAAYLAPPFGPPAEVDEKRLLAQSYLLEPRTRGGTGGGGGGTGTGTGTGTGSTVATTATTPNGQAT